jgi:hypothetical protein
MILENWKVVCLDRRGGGGGGGSGERQWRLCSRESEIEILTTRDGAAKPAEAMLLRPERMVGIYAAAMVVENKGTSLRPSVGREE